MNKTANKGASNTSKEQNADNNMTNDIIKGITNIEAEINKADFSKITALLMDIKNESEKQSKYIKNRLIVSCVTCGICIVVLLSCVFSIVPKVVTICNQADEVMSKANTLIDDTKVIAENLETVSDELSKLELEKTFNNMDALLESSESTIEAAMTKIDSLDIDGLNESIAGLSAVVKPLANLFRR